MIKTAGITPFKMPDDNLIPELKQLILLFDKIGVPSISTFITIFSKHPDKNHGIFNLINEIEYLIEQGYLFDALKTNNATIINKKADLVGIFNELKTLEKIVDGDDTNLAMEAAARISCLKLNNEDVERDFISIPIIKKLQLPLSATANRSDVLNLVIERIPIPDSQTPWENIIDFKSDPDNIGRLAGLRVWMNKVAKSNSSVVEIEDELEYLLHLYTKSLETHKIKYSQGILQSFVVGTAEIIENTAKLNFSKIANGLFSAKLAKAELLNLELKAPGNELSYIYKAKQHFK
ncbi:MAG: hypothetical protein JST49_13540 [Bacteroidetes bacterium]|nr:hypothetical protein [Bacteroidota bacterium]